MRSERVPLEPEEGSNTIKIQVRYKTRGLIKRRFLNSEKMLAVYDWVGSNSLLPLQFQLSCYSGHVVMPDEPITSVEGYTLNMAESENTPGLDDEDVQFKGIGYHAATSNDTLNDLFLL